MAFGYQVLGFGSAPTAAAAGFTHMGSRGVWGGGTIKYVPPHVFNDVMQYINIPSLGNAIDFGDATVGTASGGCNSNASRGVAGGGINGSWAKEDTIDYWTFASLGNATDFGNLTVARSYNSATFGDGTKGCWSGGNDGTYSNIIDYVNIASIGNATDFGNLTVARQNNGGTNDATRGLTAGGHAA